MASLSIVKADAAIWRAWARVFALALWFTLCLIPYGLWSLLRLPSPWGRLFFAGATAIIGVRVRIAGQPVRRNVLYVANHLSWLDILILGGRTDCAFIAKSEMLQWGLIGLISRLNHTVFVERGDRLSVAAQRHAAREALDLGYPLTLFAEGTTGDGHGLRRFHSSLFAAVEPDEAESDTAAESPVAREMPRKFLIQPVAIDYGTDAALVYWSDEESFGANALRIIGAPHPIYIDLDFLPPIDPANGNRKIWAAATRTAIAARLGNGQM